LRHLSDKQLTPLAHPFPLGQNPILKTHWREFPRAGGDWRSLGRPTRLPRRVAWGTADFRL